MPLYDYLCESCGHLTEVLVMGDTPDLRCDKCGGTSLRQVMSPTSSLTGRSGMDLPGQADTACCGATPATASGCAGPGSCCGKTIP
ncbi:MAG: zinc ribbon domain-containing protein [Proteobacteria bacterium]|nr:zinc ribbon domain-containing protein [Pseudomonadota bacterium]